MPRVARNNLESSFFHIMVHGINQEYIFNKEIYKKKYMNLLNEKKKKFNIEILAYCIMNNHAHLLIYTDELKNMSEFMRSVNTKYAQFYNSSENREGYVFRGRFKSEAIKNENYLLTCIQYIHNNPVKAKIVNYPGKYQYSSYHLFQEKKEMYHSKVLNELLNIELITNYKKEETDLKNIFIDIKDNNKEIVQIKLLELLKKENISLRELKKDKKMLLKFIEEMKSNYGIQYSKIITQIGISSSTLKRLKKYNLSIKNGPF